MLTEILFKEKEKLELLPNPTQEDKHLLELINDNLELSKPLDDLCGFIKKAVDKTDLAKQFYTRQPFYYDRARIWWLWNRSRKCWEIVDETDIMIAIDKALANEENTTRSNIKGEILEAMRRVGRINQPTPVKLTWVQFDDVIIDVATGESIDSTPKHFTLNPIPWILGDSEDTPTIDKIFEEWVGPEYVSTLYEIIAYCLLPDYPINRLFCLVGSGNNGKSCFNNLIVNLVGKENTASVNLDLICGNSASRFESAKLYKKTVGFMGETNFSTLSKTDTLKKLCGKDLIDFEFKGKDPFQDYSYAKLVINTNSLPLTNDRTKGFYRRWLIIRFPNEFTEKKDILGSIPKQEYSNLARKCVRLLKELLEKREFANEGSIEDRENRYEKYSNPLVAFINESYDKTDPDGKILYSEFREKFLNYLKEHKLRAMSVKEISYALSREGYSTKRINETLDNDFKTTKHYILGLKNTDITDNTDEGTQNSIYRERLAL